MNPVITLDQKEPQDRNRVAIYGKGISESKEKLVFGKLDAAEKTFDIRFISYYSGINLRGKPKREGWRKEVIL